MSNLAEGLLSLVGLGVGVALVAWMLYIPGETWWSILVCAISGAAVGSFSVLASVALYRHFRSLR